MNKYQEAFDVMVNNMGDVGFYTEVTLMQELVDKATPKFINECNCIFDEILLFQAIDLECKNRNIYRQNEYKIYLHNGYPCVSLAHDKARIHVLLGKLLYGKIRKGYVIHHKDRNKLNALPNNLEYISSVAHTKLHHTGVDFRSEEGKMRSINSARDKIYKSQITKEEIELMIDKGKSKAEIARHFNCGVNTIYRRLGYKF